MIVCSCNVLSDKTIKSALDATIGGVSPRTPTAVYKCLGCSPNCGRCFRTVRKIIDETLRARQSLAQGACDANCPSACIGEHGIAEALHQNDDVMALQAAE